MINNKAVFLLPDEMFGFYKANIDYLTAHAVDPDKRRYAVKSEGPRHYIDLDHYIKADSIIPLNFLADMVPIYWDSASSKYGEENLEKYGVLPWHLNLMLYKLTEAFKSKDASSILKLSSEIGHYASDAHVPLHTTENYNGQLTGQKGIHALWESRIPERKAESFEFKMERSRYIENVQEEIWGVVLSSHSYVNYVLNTEQELRSNYDADKMYRPSTVGRKVTPQFTSAYVEQYCSTNETLVQERMISSILFISSLWHTAWVNAGQPKLDELRIDEVENEKIKDKMNDEVLDHER